MCSVLFITPIQDEVSIDQSIHRSINQSIVTVFVVMKADEAGQIQERISHDDFDLILIDWDFPEKEILFDILKSPEFGFLPKMVLADQADEKEMIRLMDEGLCEVVFKSESSDLILSKIKKTIRVNAGIKSLKENLSQEKLMSAQFKAIADHTHNAESYRDKDGKLVYCNSAIEHFTGITAEEYLTKGMPFSEFIHPEDLEKTNFYFQEVVKGNPVESNIIRIINPKTRELLWADTSGMAVFSENGDKVGFRISMRDITEIKKIEQVLKESEARYKLISDYSADWEVYRDAEGKLVYCSPAVERILGYTVEEFMQEMPFDRYIHPDDIDRAMTNLGKLFERKDVYRGRYRFIRKDGEMIDLAISAQSVFIDGDVCKGFRLSGRDVTEKVKLEEELIKMNQDKDKFLSIISHDLRSPFNALIGFSQLLLEMGDDLSVDERKDYASILYDTSKSTLGLLDNLLLWTNSQSGKININLTKVYVYPIVNEVFSYLASAGQKKNIRLQNNLDKDIFVNADVNMLNAILRNLVSNAVKFTPEGGQIEIYANTVGDMVEIAVADNGVGMEDTVKNALFSSETSQSTLGTASEKGTGLGLVLCKEFAEQQGGKIWVESEIGKGSTFKFTLPLFVESRVQSE